MEDSYRTKGLRRKMVETVKGCGITDQRVLEALLKVPRHVFLDKAFVETAYENRAFSIGEGQTISQPYTVAYQTALLDVKPGDRVLEVGTGSGYQAAILAEMGAQVYTLERIKKLYDRTKSLLKSIGYKQIRCFHADGFEGLPGLAPFDKIIITAAAPEIPEKLKKQLSIGGIMIIPYGEGETQKMIKIVRVSEDAFEQEELDSFSFVPMLKGKTDQM
jgi:protein-L-isoaspartate(D-aspartate) O-methyltransferase